MLPVTASRVISASLVLVGIVAGSLWLVRFLAILPDDSELPAESLDELAPVEAAGAPSVPIPDTLEEAGDGAGEEHAPGPAVRVTVRFPTGDPVTVEIRERSRQPLPYVYRVAAEYDALARRANDGDSDAALMLYGALKSCRLSYRTADDLESAMRILRQSRRAPRPNGGLGARELDQAEMESYETVYRQLFARCWGLSDAQLPGAEDWLRASAAYGNLRALNELAVSARNTAETRSYAEALWAAGDLEGARFLGRYLSTDAPGRSSEHRDHVLAYAYQYLYDSVSRAHVERRSGAGSAAAAHYWATIGAAWHEGQDAEMARQAALLRPWEIDEAIALARRMLEANGACCVESVVTAYAP